MFIPAESIQRMLANLPAKRVCRQIFPNLQAKKRVRKFMPVNTLARNRQQMHLKQINTKPNRNFKFITTAQTTVKAIRKNISRRLRFFSTNSSEMARNTRSTKTADDQTQEMVNDPVSAKSRGIVKTITRRTQRVFPKLTNSFRRPLQKRNLRTAANGSGKTIVKETKPSSMLERLSFRKSKRVQVTLKKLDEDMIKVDEKKNVQNIEEKGDIELIENVKAKKAPAKKRPLNRLIKGVRGKRTGIKKTTDKIEIEVEQPLITIKIEEEEDVKQIDEVQDKTDVQVIHIDESSQSSSRSASSKRSKRGSVRKHQLLDMSTEMIPKEDVVDIISSTEMSSVVLESNSDISVIPQELVVMCPTSEEPMDLSQSKSKLSIPIAQEPMPSPPAKRRTRKLNDCIAMLTGKLQEKLGVPFLNSETSVLLNPTVSNETLSSECMEKDVPTNENSEGESVKCIEPQKPRTLTKEPSSNHSTPTKRSRKGRLINFDTDCNDLPKLDKPEVSMTNHIAMESLRENLTNDTKRNDVNDTSLDSIQLDESAVEVTTPIAKTSDNDLKSSVDISSETTDIEVKADSSPPLSDNLLTINPSEENLVFEEVRSPNTTPKRGSKSRNFAPADSNKSDKTSAVAKKLENGKKIKSITNCIDENHGDSSRLDTTLVANEPTCDDTAITQLSKRKETKKKLLKETVVTLDTAEPVEMENSSIERVTPKRRQTKNSTSMLSSVDSLTKEDIAQTPSCVTKAVETSNEPLKLTTKPKRGKHNGLNGSQNTVEHIKSSTAVKPKKVIAPKVKSIRRNISKGTSLPLARSEQNGTTSPKNDEQLVEIVKEVKKTRKSLKIAKESDEKTTIEEKTTESNEQVSHSTDSVATKLDLSDDEMHPWDPEVGFITAKESELPSTPIIESTICGESSAIQEPESPFKAPADQITTLPTKADDQKATIKKKRRKNELAKIIADQLLESFKEVDKSRIEELKLLHDLSIESNDDLLFTTTLSRTPPPKRRTAANIRSDALVDLDTSFEETNSSEDIEVSGKTMIKRKRTITVVDNKKVVQNTKVAMRRKVGQKVNRKDGKKKTDDIVSSGYLSDSEICQAKEPKPMRRRLTICDESPKRMSRNSKETEVAISLFDSMKNPKNESEITTKEYSNESKSKVQPKVRKRRNRRNALPQMRDDHLNVPSDKNTILNDVEDTGDEKISSHLLANSGQDKATVNDMVAQIINDFTTSTLNSPTTSPIVFGDAPKSNIGLNNTVAKLSTVLTNTKNILNGEILSNGFNSDASKEITFATLSQPLKDKSVELIRNTDASSGTKPVFRAPFMSPRWEQTDEWNASSKVPCEVPVKDPALHKLWTLNNKDEKLSSEKSLYQSVKEKTKKLFGKISKKKVRKHDGALMNNKTAISTAVGLKRPLLRPSILSVSNATTKVDIVESENCLKKLESNSLFLGKNSNFENDSISNIFLNDKASATTMERNKNCDFATESELFGTTNVLDSLKANIEKEIGSKAKIEKLKRNNTKKGKGNKGKEKILTPLETSDNTSRSRSTKKQANKKSLEKTSAVIMDELKGTEETTNTIASAEKSKIPAKIVEENVVKTVTKGTFQRRKMGSTKRRTGVAVDKSTASDNLNNAFCDDEYSRVKPAKSSMKTIEKPIITFEPCYESSQDTIISEIVNKIRDANNEQATESDEDLSLAEIAKNLNNKILNCDEFSNDGNAPPLELSESFVGKSNFNTLVSVLHDQLEPKIDKGNEQFVDCINESSKVYTDVDDSEFLNENTNTELIDMDLEDTASVYTSSMETTVTTSGGSQKRRKRRHGRSILMKSSRKSKRSDGGFLAPDESYFCDICSKTFRTQGGLATHRTTLTHISKLSEQEFKLKMEPPKDVMPEPKPTIEEDVATKPDNTLSPIIESSSQPHIPLSQSPPSVQRHQPVMSPIRNQSMTYLNNIEPISSPEQHDLSYDCYSITPRSRNHLPVHENSRLALSQEQRFFYECCSMLKGSDRSNVNQSDSPNKYYTLPQRSEVINKPVTPRSNEQYSYVVPEGSKHSKGIPKIDLNQFSDISSDSNPAYSCPQNPSSSETQNIFPVESKTNTENDYHSLETNSYDVLKNDGRTFDDRTTNIDREYMETFSDMGDSFPSSQDVSESEQYVQTILERSSNATGIGGTGYHDNYSVAYTKNSEGDKKTTNLLTLSMEGNEAKGFPNRLVSFSITVSERHSEMLCFLFSISVHQ